ncbi:MAG: hypothetical protein J2P56_02080 [Verrucomicrobia bacterium]|nr:hypothetical protein [Verrucomicrobiota bacterium]
MKTTIICLAIASGLFTLDFIIKAEGTPTPAPMTHSRAITADEIALFQPDGSVWLTIHQRRGNDWRPSSVDILVDYQPIVKKVRGTTGEWQYQITFSSERAQESR